MPSRDTQTPAIIPLPNALTRCHCLPSLPHSGIHFAQRQVTEDPPPPPCPPGPSPSHRTPPRTIGDGSSHSEPSPSRTVPRAGSHPLGKGSSVRGPRPCGATPKKTGIACTSTEASIDKLRGKQRAADPNAWRGDSRQQLECGK